MNVGAMTFLVVDTDHLRRISELPAELALQQAVPFVVRSVMDPAFFEGEIRPLLEKGEALQVTGTWHKAMEAKTIPTV
jgi:hypothetical protein